MCGRQSSKDRTELGRLYSAGTLSVLPFTYVSSGIWYALSASVSVLPALHESVWPDSYWQLGVVQLVDGCWCKFGACPAPREGRRLHFGFFLDTYTDMDEGLCVPDIRAGAFYTQSASVSLYRVILVAIRVR